MNGKLYLVCRSGGEYNRSHVERIRASVANMDVATLTDLPDVPNRIPLLYNWRGWWSKLELFRPDIIGDVFYMDLDSTVIGDLSDMANLRKTTMLSDFYRPEHLQSSVMLLTQADRRRVWQAWITEPLAHIERYSARRVGFNGDQNFIEDVLGAYCVRRFQMVLPGQIESYKVDLRRGTVRPGRDTRLICFHGNPRPWALDVPDFAK